LTLVPKYSREHPHFEKTKKRREKTSLITKPFVFELIFKGENKGVALARGKTAC